VAELDPNQRLHVLIANEGASRLAELEAIVRGLGHDVVARETDPVEAAQLTRDHRPDIALVALDDSSEHALALIGKIVHEATCPVIAVLEGPNPDFVAQAARRGIFGYVDQDDPIEFQSAIELVLQRFAAFRNLEGAFGRRALIERAKGILMERRQISERDAFELLRRNARASGRKLTDIASAVTDSYLVLRPGEEKRPTGSETD
jgi:AmiR/NasT family two-component response regulator